MTSDVDVEEKKELSTKDMSTKDMSTKDMSTKDMLTKELSAKNMLEVVIQKLEDIEQLENKRDERFKQIEEAINKLDLVNKEQADKSLAFLKLLTNNVANMEQVILELSKEIASLRKLDATKDLINELSSFRIIMTTVLKDIPQIVEESLKKQEQFLDINNKSVQQNNKIIEHFESILNTVNDAEMIELKKAIEVANKNTTLTSELLHNAIELKSITSEERSSNTWLKMLQRKK